MAGAEDKPPRAVAGSGADGGRDAARRRARRVRARRRTIRARRRAAAAALVVALAAALALSGAWSSSAGRPRGRRALAVGAGATGAGAGGTRGAAGASTASGGARGGAADAVASRGGSVRAGGARTARRAVRRRRAPGRLPQTDAFPSARGARFKAAMASLWAGVTRGSVRPALAAFFPKAAYLQLKAIPGAGSDWTGRLVHDYALDIAAAHALLGAEAARARLVRVAVPAGYGHWVPPGVCYNRVGYYELPNARVIYSVAGRVRSFGIASMISWRGEWYVVHLGAVLRSSDAGVVDAPASGPGTSAYSGTC